MKKPKIHQFHSGSAVGDAITNGLIYIQQLLQNLGFESNIYVEHRAQELEGRLCQICDYKSDSENILLIHHSMGHDRLDWLLGLADRKILVYHNITPASFFTEGSYMQNYAIKGREMLQQMKPYIVASTGDSEENIQELRELGYTNPRVFPALLDQRKIATSSWNDAIVQTESKNNIILYVGRIATNKCQHDLITLAAHLLHLTEERFKIVLIGGYDETDSYYRSLVEQIKNQNLNGIVQFTGKVSDADLRGWYRAATLYASMSEHEGFGVPFIESMLFDLPIIAYKCHAIPYVLGDAGIMFDTKNLEQIAGLVAELLVNRSLRRALIREQRHRVADFAEPQILRTLTLILNEQGIECSIPEQLMAAPGYPPYTTPQWQFEGPFETSYSLALVNRHLATALDEMTPGSVSLWPTEGPGDYTPNPEQLAQHPNTINLHKRALKASQANIIVRNLWPPRYRDMDGLTNLASFAWEESAVPQEIVNEINASVDGLITPSGYCRTIYINNGIKVPIRVVGHGWDHLQIAPHKKDTLELPGKFRFIHVSSAFPRKGIENLLMAFEMAFNDDQDVVLILKTFPNIHNKVKDLLADLQIRNPCLAKQIVWMDRDMSVAELVGLYKNCQAFVSATRGEGFGLPMLEAMALELPVIVTAKGGHADFCTETTAWTVKCKAVPSDSHLTASNSFWFEADIEDMVRQMKLVRTGTRAYIRKRVNAAKQLVFSEFTWAKTAKKTKEFAENLSNVLPYSTSPVRVGFVSTWNSKCGIASYSKNLINHLRQSINLDLSVLSDTNLPPLSQDEPWVYRVWRQSFSNDFSNIESLEQAIFSQNNKVAIIQFNFGFFNINLFGAMLDRLHDAGKATILIFHSTKDVNKPDLKVSLSEIKASLTRCYRLLVHSYADVARFASWGLENNTAIFPHGVTPRDYFPAPNAGNIQKTSGPPLIATFGYCLPQKGLLEAIEAFAIFQKSEPNAHLLMLNAYYSKEASESTASACKATVAKLGLSGAVTLNHNYLPEKQCLEILDTCDLAIFTYTHTDESSSAAVRMALQAKCKVLCTPLAIFDDVKDCVCFSQDITIEAIAKSMHEIILNPDITNPHYIARKHYFETAKWKCCSDRLEAMILNAP